MDRCRILTTQEVSDMANEHKLYSKEKVDCQKLALSFYRVHVRIFKNGLNKAYSGRSWASLEIKCCFKHPLRPQSHKP